MNIKDLDIKIDKYLNENWETIVEDIKELIKIPSVNNPEAISKEYPSGPEPAKALDTALNTAKEMGFDTQNYKNIIGIADYKGKSDTQIGFIGHLDVVPEGPGWHFDPYDLTIIDDYMIGRGIIDDKGPVIVLLHAINFWIKQNIEFPYSIRFLFGSNEESGSSDVETYKEKFKQPKLVITPDANFPICYGEKGLYRIKVVSKEIKNGYIKDIYGGVANNAVSGLATAIVKKKNDQWVNKQGSRLAHAISIEEIASGLLDISAHGRSAHAAIPYSGIDSIAVLSRFLLEKNIGNDDEKDFLIFLARVAGRPNGQSFGLDCRGLHLSRLTIVPSILRFNNNRFEQIFDIRYPGIISPEEIEEKITKHLPDGAKIEPISNVEPMLLNPKSTFIEALSKAFTDATGKKAKRFTMGGATYARDFDHASSFGPIMDWEPNPAWVGSLHGPDEGIKVKVMKQTFKIYVHAIKELMKLNIDEEGFFDNIKLNKESIWNENTAKSKEKIN